MHLTLLSIASEVSLSSMLPSFKLPSQSQPTPSRFPELYLTEGPQFQRVGHRGKSSLTSTDSQDQTPPSDLQSDRSSPADDLYYS